MTHTLGEPRFVTLDDGRRLHLRVRGSGSPTVVLESGMGLSAAYWGLVVPLLAGKVTTVVYDRAGSGLSDDDAEPRTLARLTSDLAQVLDTLDGPFVLAGHSWGGPVVRSLAATGAVDVKGLVLVDQTDENSAQYFTEASRKHFERAPGLMVLLARTRLNRLLFPAARALPPDARTDFREHDLSLRMARHTGDEMVHLIPDLEGLMSADGRFPGLDVTVISGTKVGPGGRKLRPSLVAAHRATAEAAERGRWVGADGSSHQVPLTDPELVAREILRVAGA